jgi:hypothetical protein
MNWGIETGSIPAPGSNEKTRYDILCKELGKFLDDIGPSKSFVIYMFSTDSVVMPLSAGPPHTMVPTTTPNKSSSMNWVTTTMAPNNGGTKPLDAIKDALNHEPDVIYFLTDGTFSPDPTTEAAEAAVISYIDTNKGNTIINTIGLSSAANMVPLETIANLTGGKAYPVEFP